MSIHTSAKAEITFPSVVRDLLIFAPSCDWAKEKENDIYIIDMPKNLSGFNYICFPYRKVNVRGFEYVKCRGEHIFTFSLVPVAPVESALSLPAKSTKLILLTYNRNPKFIKVQHNNWQWKMLKLFILIAEAGLIKKKSFTVFPYHDDLQAIIDFQLATRFDSLQSIGL